MSKEIYVLAVDGKYSDNNGAWDVATVWDGKKLSYDGSMYNPSTYNYATPICRDEEVIYAASRHFDTVAVEHNNKHSFVNCVVKLKRSRKAPNNKPLKVLQCIDAHYDSRFNCRVDDKVVVLDEETGNKYTVNYSCISEMVKGVIDYPRWYMPEQ